MCGKWCAERETIFAAPNQRLGQIDRVVHDIDPSQIVALPDPVAVVTLALSLDKDAVAAVIVFFDMRRRDLEELPSHTAVENPIQEYGREIVADAGGHPDRSAFPMTAATARETPSRRG